MFSWSFVLPLLFYYLLFSWDNVSFCYPVNLCQFAVSWNLAVVTTQSKHQPIKNRQCLCSSVFLHCSSPETRLQDLSIGQLEWNRGTDRICPRDMRTGLWRRPPTLHDGEAGSHQISILESFNDGIWTGGVSGIENSTYFCWLNGCFLDFYLCDDNLIIHDGKPY